MSDDSLDIFLPQEGAETPTKSEQFEDDIYKKWFKTKSKSGFLAVRTWLDAGKVSIDIGETGGEGLRGNTQVWTNAIELVVYLRALYDGNATRLYENETFTYYGGGQVNGQPVSRILKIAHWSKEDTTAFAWKCGHFEARKADSGAFIPDMNKNLSLNLIKMTRKEMAEIYYRLDLDIQSYAAKNENAFLALNGNKR